MVTYIRHWIRGINKISLNLSKFLQDDEKHYTLGSRLGNVNWLAQGYTLMIDEAGIWVYIHLNTKTVS